MDEDKLFRDTVDALMEAIEYVEDKVCDFIRWISAVIFVVLALLIMVPFVVLCAVLAVTRVLRGIGQSFMKGFRGDHT